ncbi:DJ-1/PfpI family protein [Aquimarina sp. U1-2]|uniref:DJ-1/PfpI family protein n=1 Tax=Aquimarina sp. U1-2 TaxID=2823141 RepID=UPI001AECD8CC|nr:DJ-1/PfpI family protein [Aquimarina sp. U1-2]MBP2831877.1 DJ-1/PfpI family protein [Aquimarina sp. U1-2]
MKQLIIVWVALIGLSTCQTKNEEKVNPINEVSAPETENMTHDEAMKLVKIKEHNVKKVGVLVYDGVNDLDALGPRYVFKNIMGTNVMTIALKPGNVKTVMGLEFVPDTTIDNVNNLDILVIPGGFKETIKNVYNEELLQWIRDIDKTTQYTTSVCTGGWILGKTGLLNGKKATGNWFRAEEILAENGAIFTGERYTQDGKYWTSAGVTAGTDMSLAIMTELTGEDYTQAVMLDMEYDPEPPIEGGSVEKTKPEVLHFMQTMYASMADPVFKEMEAEQDSIPNNKVKSYGNRQAIINGNDLSGILKLDTTLSRKYNYAIGPVKGLQGEITVYNDTISISTVVSGKPSVSEDTRTEAIFLLQANQKDWNEIATTKQLNGLNDIESYIENSLIENGMEVSKAYPFRIETTVPSMEYHIIFKTDNKPHNKKEHQKAKQKFTLENEPVKIIGFWVDEARVGKLTHSGKRTHLHFMTKDKRTSGHVDAVVIPKGSILYLPKSN